MSLERAISDRVVAGGFASADTSSTGTGWLVFDGTLSDRPTVVGRPQIAVMLAGGPGRTLRHAGARGTRYGRVRVLVRGDPWDYYGSRDKALALAEDLNGRHFTLGSENALLRQEESALWLGYNDEESRPMWSLNFMASIV